MAPEIFLDLTCLDYRSRSRRVDAEECASESALLCRELSSRRGRGRSYSIRTRVYMANPALVIATGIFVLLSVIGFFWMNKLIAQNSYSYLASLDYSNTWNIATASGCVALFAYIVYMINYPEGELARDAAATFKEKKAERDLARDRDAKKVE